MPRALSVFLTTLVILMMPVLGVANDKLTANEIEQLFDDIEEVKGGYVAKFIHRVPYIPGDQYIPKVPDKGQPVEKLVKRLQKNPYSYGFDKVGRTLTQRGIAVVPLLLKELENARDYYRLSLINILSGIHCPERDAAFQMQLEKLLREDRDFLADDTAKPLMQTLATRKFPGTAPLLRNFLDAENMEKETRGEARIALGRLGELDLSAVPNVSYESAASFPAGSAPLQEALLATLLKYELLHSPLTLAELEPGDANTTILRGAIDQGTWYIRFGSVQSERVPFYYTWHTGPLASAGYIGVLEKTGDQWLLVFWQMIWIS